MKLLKRLSQFGASLLGALVLFSFLSIVGYWIFAFVYYGSHGTFDGLAEFSLAHVIGIKDLGLTRGGLGYQALRTCGPGVFTLPPSYLALKLYERLVPV